MSELLTWSTTANSNNSTPPDGFPEGMFPSTVNNSAREMMASLARFSDMLGIPHINVGFTAAVASNDLTVTLKNVAGNNPSSTDPVCVFFRNTTLATGQRLAVNYTASTSVVLPGGGSLGFANSESGLAYIWAVYDGTNKDIGISRTPSHDDLVLHSTTTIGTGSDALDAIYTTTGRTNAAIRLLGRISIQYGTAAWTNAPTNLAVLTNDKSTFTGISVQSFTTPGANTYTPTSGMKYCIAVSTGGGGGGGGADTNGVDLIVACGGGGGGGSTCIELFTAAQIGASQTVTIGSAGTAGAALNGASGGNGGDTTFGALHTAGGGVGGTGSVVGSSETLEIAGGAGGTASNGLINIRGQDGGNAAAGSCDGTTNLIIGWGGDGGSSLWGGGGRGAAEASAAVSTDVNAEGSAAVVYGGGGGGALSYTSTTGAAGGAGMSGFCMVIEFT